MRYLRLPEILARTGVSWITIWRWEKKGEFPKRHRLGGRTIGWRESDFEHWYASREARP